MAYNHIEAFKHGHYYNNVVAEHLRLNGIRCHVPELRIAKTSAEIKEFTTGEKDIILEAHSSVLEVKTSRRSFPWNPADFPFGDTIVDTVSSYESKAQKPIAYILYSQQTQAMVALPPSSKERWRIARLYDKYQEIYDDFYIIDKSDIRSMQELIDFLLLKQSACFN